MKKFFRIEKNYSFEINDLRAVLVLLNFYLIIRYNISFYYLVFAASIFGIIKDYTIDKKINGFIIHIIGALLSLYNIFGI